MSIDLTNGLEFDTTPQHYIIFGEFDSRAYGLKLHERAAPTPEEKVISASIPYRQGTVDFSNMRGARVYENREIVYTFYLPQIEQENANSAQTAIENLIMQGFNETLHDSYDTEYHYVGKCSGIETTDDFEFKRLIIEITFDLYPFKIGNNLDGNDDWDTFNFDTDVFQDVKFSIGAGGTVSAQMYNVGVNTSMPTIIINITSGDIPDDGAYFNITCNGVTYSYAFGTHIGGRLKLKTGLNELLFNCTLTSVAWTVEFGWYRELI